MLRLGDKEVEQIDSIGTGSVGLDLALGIGGVPKGRIIEIYGPERSGKTTLTLHIIAECQKAGGVCAFTRCKKKDTHLKRNFKVALSGANTTNALIFRMKYPEARIIYKNFLDIENAVLSGEVDAGVLIHESI
ncbi:hypothetical protein DDV89_10130, partial [Campylobacter jejuni]